MATREFGAAAKKQKPPPELFQAINLLFDTFYYFKRLLALKKLCYSLLIECYNNRLFNSK